MIAPFNKIRRIKAKLKGESEESLEVPYEVRCECGRPIRGIRRASWIEAECNDCYQSTYVLPANCYPSTPSVPSEVVGGDFSERLKAAFNEIWPAKKVSEPGVEEETPPSDRPSGKSKKKATEVAPAEEAAESPLPHRRRFQPVRLLKQVFTPFRLLMMAMVSVVGLTIYWITFQQQMEAAQQIWLAAPERTERLIQDADFLQLEKALTNAVEAGVVLGKADPEFRRLSNLLDETHAINNMAAEQLLTAFHSAYDKDQQLLANNTTVNKAAESGTYIFDSWLDTNTEDSPVVEFPATPAQHAVRVYVPFNQLAEVAEKSDGRIVFAGRIHTVVSPSDTKKRPWIVLIDPDSLVLLTSQPHCESVGLGGDDDPELPNVLERQQAFVAESDAWNDRLQHVTLPQGFERESDQ